MTMKPVVRPEYFREPPKDDWTQYVWDRDLARRVDQLSWNEFQIAAAALMESAGRAVAKAAIDRGAANHPVIVMCGQGNNGGDGLVAARVLHDQGCAVTVVIVGEDGKTPTDLFSRQLSTVRKMSIQTTNWSPGSLKALGLTRPILIDAVSGLGFKPPCDGIMMQALTEASKLQDATVIAVDLPSGISADEGNIASAPLPAHETVTFGSSRPVHRLMPAAANCGHITVADIGFPKAAIALALKTQPAVWREVNPQRVLRVDPWRSLPKDAHKYDRGHVLIIGGSPGKIGAPVMAGMAALRCGAGWCSVAISRGETTPDMTVPNELTVESFFDGNQIDSQALRDFLSERRVNAIVCGPGWMKQCLTTESLGVLRDFAGKGGSVILDAGALHGIFNLLGKAGKFPDNRLILTPHHGEWQKLQYLAAPAPLNPEGAASAAKQASALGATIIYKNAAPVIISPDDASPVICSSGTNILARAGSGDLLAGIIAAHMAAGCGAAFAAARGYTLLSRTAWIAAQDVGEDAVIGTDILNRIGIGARM